MDLPTSLPFFDLPGDLQQLIWGLVPLRKLAQMASLSKELRVVCLDRVKKRDAAVATMVESCTTAEFREGLWWAKTALPRDLIVDPPVRQPYFPPPFECASRLIVLRMVHWAGLQFLPVN